MKWTLIVAPCVGMCVFAFAAVAAAQPTQSMNPLAQPLRDVGFVRDRVPEVLARAAAAPYAMPTPRADGRLDCAVIGAEIGALDEELGSDVNMRIEQRASVGSFIAGAVRGAIDVPYRGVVRRITGAERRDQAIREATQAGMVRRAFLKGMRDTDCTGALAPLQEEALASAHAPPPALRTDEFAETRAPAPQTRIVAMQTIAATSTN